MLAMEKPAIISWLEANRESLPLGLAIAGGIIAAMLGMRWIGSAMSRADPGCSSWKGVIGRVLAKADEARISVKTVIEPVAEALGNTVAMSRKSYVHPVLIEATKDNPRDPLDGMKRPRSRKWLSGAEVGFLKFLKQQKRRRKRSA